MSGSQKALKVISIVLLIYAVIMLLFGILMAAGSQVPGLSGTVDMGDGVAMDATMAAMSLGLGFIISAVVYFVISLIGLRGAKNPRKIGLFFVLCIIGLVLGVLGMGMSLAQGSFQWQSLVGILIIAVCTYLAAKIKKQA